VNAAFTNSNIRCNFIPVQSHKKKSGVEQQKTESNDEKEIKLERQNILDAVVVRIMKVK
jgi:hypothetical protein